MHKDKDKHVVLFDGVCVEFDCPGCGLYHIAPIRCPGSGSSRPSWVFNGDPVKPTLEPSYNTQITKRDSSFHMRCHFYLRDGVIEFLSDCTHDSVGKSVPLEPMEV